MFILNNQNLNITINKYNSQYFFLNKSLFKKLFIIYLNFAFILSNYVFVLYIKRSKNILYILFKKIKNISSFILNRLFKKYQIIIYKEKFNTC